MKPSEVFAEAADRIRNQKHWTQNRFTDFHGRVCALGALNQVLTGSARKVPYEDRSHDRLYSFANRVARRYSNCCSLLEANDIGGHVVALAVLDKAEEITARWGF